MYDSSKKTRSDQPGSFFIRAIWWPKYWGEVVNVAPQLRRRMLQISVAVPYNISTEFALKTASVKELANDVTVSGEIDAIVAVKYPVYIFDISQSGRTQMLMFRSENPWEDDGIPGIDTDVIEAIGRTVRVTGRR